MKNIFIKILSVFTFILMFMQGVYASALNISSVNFDNSAAILAINSFDNGQYGFDVNPKIFVDSENKKAYVDISPAILNCPLQNIVLNSDNIEQITVSQYSRSEEIVRIAFSYNDKFNPNNVRLKKLNNSLFLSFKNTSINNYYFQGVYQENNDLNFYENVTIQNPVQVAGDSILGQINSAFDIDSTKNFILVKKNLILPSKYYLDHISFNNGYPLITGIGSYSLSKPFYLSNPNRMVIDLHNAVVNPAIRNKIMNFGSNDSIKIGQFDKNTVRVVITSDNPTKYQPIVYADAQKFAIYDKTTQIPQKLYSSTATLNSSKYEKSSKEIDGLKMIFSSPLVFGVSRGESEIELDLYNVSNYALDIINSSIEKTGFSDAKLNKSNDGITKLVFPTTDCEYVNIHMGADGKTLRIRQKHKVINDSDKNSENNLSDIDLSKVVPALRTDGKRYIVIDPGHGGSDCGALRDSINEKDITLDVALRLEKLLVKKGYVVQMTRTSDNTVSLQERVDISEAFMPDVFVSIHVNSSNSETPSGLETHYYKENSLQLAKCLHASMLNHINSNNRGLFKSKFYVINHTTAPAVLVEIGFLSNPRERSQLISDSRKEATAKAIAEGIDEYFK